MTAQERDRLAKRLGMLGSNFDGERAAAAAKAHAFIRERKLTWSQVLGLPPAISEQARASAVYSRPWSGLGVSAAEIVDHCDATADWHKLTEWECGFVRDVAGRWSAPGEKQAAVLERVARKLGLGR